jgi:hypothetical protein
VYPDTGRRIGDRYQVGRAGGTARAMPQQHRRYGVRVSPRSCCLTPARSCCLTPAQLDFSCAVGCRNGQSRHCT